MRNGKRHFSDHISVITLLGSGSEYTINGVVNECVSLQYNKPRDPTFIRLDFVIRAFISDVDVSATAYILAPIPAQIFVRFFDAKQNNSISPSSKLYL